ncbi:hypothetical protein VTN00DRAFT_1018 [Thermoascus crustaceus]|uniref:uncharacterized protein n=1 Tax=Thermoascus crustaceus TaxID=5088 RepID=UPI003742090B
MVIWRDGSRALPSPCRREYGNLSTLNWRLSSVQPTKNPSTIGGRTVKLRPGDARQKHTALGPDVCGLRPGESRAKDVTGNAGSSRLMATRSSVRLRASRPALELLFVTSSSLPSSGAS